MSKEAEEAKKRLELSRIADDLFGGGHVEDDFATSVAPPIEPEPKRQSRKKPMRDGSESRLSQMADELFASDDDDDEPIRGRPAIKRESRQRSEEPEQDVFRTRRTRTVPAKKEQTEPLPVSHDDDVLTQISYDSDQMAKIDSLNDDLNQMSISNGQIDSVARQPSVDVSQKDSAERHAKVAMMRMNSGNFKAAVEFWSMAIDKNSEEPYFHSQRGLCHLEMKQFDNALIDSDKAVNMDKSHLPYEDDVQHVCFYVKGQALIGLGRFREAEPCLQFASDYYECDEYKTALRTVRELELKKLDFPDKLVKHLARTHTSIQEAVDQAIVMDAQSAKDGSKYGVTAFRNQIRSISVGRDKARREANPNTHQNGAYASDMETSGYMSRSEASSSTAGFGRQGRERNKTANPVPQRGRSGYRKQHGGVDGDNDDARSTTSRRPQKSSYQQKQTASNYRNDDNYDSKSMSSRRSQKSTHQQQTQPKFRARTPGPGTANQTRGRSQSRYRRERHSNNSQDTGIDVNDNEDATSVKSFKSTRSVNRVRPHRAVSFPEITDNDRKILPENHTKMNGLVVFNLMSSVNQYEIKEHFAKFGKVVRVIMTFHHSLRSAYVHYAAPGPPSLAIQYYQGRYVPDLSVDGKKLVLRFAPGQGQAKRDGPSNQTWTSRECYFWRTTGCDTLVRKCTSVHHPICRTIDLEPWMINQIRY
ncbi:hypothetical protein HDE_12802 [Halotydeus destructor]|nr:hypothetical protein HDE_12802 [Halotydeus destructor]